MPVIVEGITTEQLGRSISDWVKAATIETAERALREEVAKGLDTEPVVITEGMPGRDYRQVKLFGRIEFAARTSMAEAVRWALTELQKRSPVLTGRYASSHTVMINGAEIQGNIWVALRNVQPTDRVQIVNPQPYARKIEGATANRRTGRGKRAALSRQARSGVYRAVLRALVNRFGKALFFDFKYVNLNIGIKVWGKRGAGRVQRDQVYPALQFFIKPTGLPHQGQDMIYGVHPIVSVPLGATATGLVVGDPVRTAFRERLIVWLADLGIGWPIRDLDNTDDSPDVSQGFVALEFPGGTEDQYTFGAPGLNFWREQGQVTLYVKTRLGAGILMRNLAESYAGALRAQFRNDRFPAGNGTVRIVSTAPMGAGTTRRDCGSKPWPSDTRHSTSAELAERAASRT